MSSDSAPEQSEEEDDDDQNEAMEEDNDEYSEDEGDENDEGGNETEPADLIDGTTDEDDEPPPKLKKRKLNFVETDELSGDELESHCGLGKLLRVEHPTKKVRQTRMGWNEFYLNNFRRPKLIRRYERDLIWMSRLVFCGPILIMKKCIFL